MENVRLECLRLAAIHPARDVIDEARRYYEFVTGADKSAPQPTVGAMMAKAARAQRAVKKP